MTWPPFQAIPDACQPRISAAYDIHPTASHAAFPSAIIDATTNAELAAIVDALPHA